MPFIISAQRRTKHWECDPIGPDYIGQIFIWGSKGKFKTYGIETLKTDLSCLMFTWNSGHPQPHLILFYLGRQVWNEIWPCRDNITELRTAGIDSNRYNRIESPWPGPRTVSSKHNKFRWNRCPLCLIKGNTICLKSISIIVYFYRFLHQLKIELP